MVLEFDPLFHEYKLNGKRLPSVTEVLAPLEDFSMVPPATLEAARQFGNHVHEAMALLVREQLDWAALDPALVPYIVGGKRFIDESGTTVIASECRLGCARLRVAGTLDIVGHWQNSEAVFDWKATATIPRSVGPQTAAYDKLYSSMFGGRARKRYCVQLRPNDYRVVALTDPADASIFQSCLNLHHWKNKHANAA